MENMELVFDPRLLPRGVNPSDEPDEAESLFWTVLPSLQSFLEGLQKKVFCSVDQIVQSIREWRKPESVTDKNPFLTIQEERLEGFGFLPLLLEAGNNRFFHIGSFVPTKDLSYLAV